MIVTSRITASCTQAWNRVFSFCAPRVQGQWHTGQRSHVMVSLQRALIAVHLCRNCVSGIAFFHVFLSFFQALVPLCRDVGSTGAAGAATPAFWQGYKSVFLHPQQDRNFQEIIGRLVRPLCVSSGPISENTHHSLNSVIKLFENVVVRNFKQDVHSVRHELQLQARFPDEETKIYAQAFVDK